MWWSAMSAVVLIRADATPEVGSGHAMRCLALAHAWQARGGQAVFAFAAATPATEARVRQERVAIRRLDCQPGSDEDGAQTARLARDADARAVVLDGYHFGAAYQQALKSAGLPVLLIDDNGLAGRYSVDWVLNQNLHADPGLYATRDRGTRLLLGSRYVLLRREFWQWRGWQRAVPEAAGRVLVTFGGGDWTNVSSTAIRAVRHLQGEAGAQAVPLECVVVAGDNNPHWPALAASAGDQPCGLRLLRSTTDMPGLMMWADVAVTAGGTTCWESAFLGLPACVVVTADNQAASVERFHDAGVALKLGRAAECSAADLARALGTLLRDGPKRRTMSERGRALVDGWGAERVAEILWTAAR
jgi:UDP-2,4-diacetamido-2,4,6-trideoxy-beta-L-altropyranose hydrolase